MTKKKLKSLINTVKVLKITQEAGGKIRPKDLAMKLWPDSPCWTNARACGPKGRHAGMGMYCSAGCYAGTLAKKGLLNKVGKEYLITANGAAYINTATATILEENEKRKARKDREDRAAAKSEQPTTNVAPLQS